jgi:hypothetical protein
MPEPTIAATRVQRRADSLQWVAPSAVGTAHEEVSSLAIATA